ncbi:MAG: EF-P lysine aminoacylase GenX [Gammaproteobacteria bacterium]|nr:MAG: EF-P lysine aminoacylase GenX [Gammaproteobacteria bacterium]
MDWQPSCSLQALKLRARVLADIRAFFASRGVMEVETPLLSASTATDPGLDSFELEAEGRRFLLTSPEPHMKRLLAAGSGPIFQISRAFRRGEAGRRHNPEFTMLEWYRPGFSLEALEAELLDLIRALGWQAPAEHATYGELFRRYLGLDPFTADNEALIRQAAQVGQLEASVLDRETALDLLFSHCVEPRLVAHDTLVVSGYPASQAALARTSVNEDGQAVALRFELYLRGIEVANAYDELADETEQARRACSDNEVRQARGLPDIPEDARFLAAVGQLPPASGIALGVDRLIMVLGGYASLAEVLAFDWARA